MNKNFQVSSTEATDKLAVHSTSPFILRNRFFVLIFIFIVCAIVLLPVVVLGIPTNSHDGLTHVRWQHYLSNQLWQGDLYPRWITGLNQGFGSPVFFVYPPLPHFVAAALAFGSDDPTWVAQRLGISLFLGYFFSGVGAFHWLKEIVSKKSALIGSCFYLIAPYHLFIDVYLRGAYAELWAFTWAPYTLLATHWFISRSRAAVLLYVSTITALLLSHAPSCIAFLPLYILYAGMVAFLQKSYRTFFGAIFSIAIAFFISAIYLSTALTHQSFINSNALFSGYFNFFDWLLLNASRSRDGAKLAVTGVALMQTTIALVFGICLLRVKKKIIEKIWLTRFSIAAAIAMFFFMTWFSTPVWLLLSFAQKIQFAWRLLATQTVILALLASLYVDADASSTAKNGGSWKWRLVSLFLFSLLAANIGMFVYEKPSFTPTSDPGSLDTPEYRIGSISLASKYFINDQKAVVLSGKGTVNVKVWDPRSIRLLVTAQSDITLAIRQFSYPGWQCQSSLLSAPCKILAPDKIRPFVSIALPAGVQELDIRLLPLWPERLGKMVSLFGLFLLFVFFLVAPSLLVRRKADNGENISAPAKSPKRIAD